MNIWHKLWQPGSRWLLGIPIGGIIAVAVGAIGLATFNEVLHYTSSNDFCFSCHSHEVNIRPEYEASTHFSNASGVRAECQDCHLPQDSWFDLVTTKIIVSADIIPELMGELDTPEKWQAHKSVMAETVWEEFRENDSRFCRSCHDTSAMMQDEQSRRARRGHEEMQSEDKTCIDCHQGIVHALPLAAKN